MNIIEFLHPHMINHINQFGIESFNNAVFYGAFNEVLMDFVHPEEELKSLEKFNEIQQAFINVVN